MIWAIKNDNKIKATPKDSAFCPICKTEIIPKCGCIKIWHWAHKSLIECDNWSEPESEWHINWKNEFPKEQQEFTMGRHRADIRTKNRLIIELQSSPISPDEIIERENYYKRMIWLINGETICSGLNIRKKNDIITFRWKSPSKSWWFSKKRIYIDLSGLVKNLKIQLQKYLDGKVRHKTPYYEQIEYEYYTPEAEHMEVSYPKIAGYDDTTKFEINRLKENINLLDGNLFLIKKIYTKIPCGGWGILIKKEDFLKEMKNENN